MPLWTQNRVSRNPRKEVLTLSNSTVNLRRRGSCVILICSHPHAIFPSYLGRMRQKFEVNVYIKRVCYLDRFIYIICGMDKSKSLPVSGAAEGPSCFLIFFYKHLLAQKIILSELSWISESIISTAIPSRYVSMKKECYTKK